MTWSPWESLGPTLLDSDSDDPPALASRLPNQIDVFRIVGHRIFHANDDWVSGPRWDQLAWNEVSRPDDGNTLGIAAVARGARSLHLAVNSNSHLKFRSFDGHEWLPWMDAGGRLGARPAIAAFAPDMINFVVWNPSDGRYHSRFRYPDGQWSSWHNIGEGRFVGPPTLISTHESTLDVFGVGEDLGIWTNHFHAGWQGWRALGRKTRQEIAVSSRGPTRYEVFYRRSDNQIESGFMNDGVWGGWETHPCYTEFTPFAVSHTEGTVDLYHYGRDGLYRRRWT